MRVSANRGARYKFVDSAKSDVIVQMRIAIKQSFVLQQFDYIWPYFAECPFASSSFCFLSAIALFSALSYSRRFDLVSGRTADWTGELSQTLRYLEKTVGQTGPRCPHRSRATEQSLQHSPSVGYLLNFREEFHLRRAERKSVGDPVSVMPPHFIIRNEARGWPLQVPVPLREIGTVVPVKNGSSLARIYE